MVYIISPEPTDTFTVFQGQGRAKRWRHHPFPEQRPERKACSSNTVYTVHPQNPQTCLPCFGLGTCRKAATSPCHEGAEARKEGMPLNTVSGVSLRTCGLVDCGFRLGTCGKVAPSPCLNGAEARKEVVLLSSIHWGRVPVF